jgi:predicted aminopeptidase
VLGRVEAYSTLGWFKDPLTLSLIESSTVDLVETVLHEMTHSTLYVKGQGKFNEGLATLVGKQGSYLFMKETFGPYHPLTLEAQKSIEEERVFSFFLASLLSELSQVYDSSLTYQEKLREREKIFALAQERFRSLSGELETPRFARFAQGPLNNAILVSLAVYHGHYPLFERGLKQSGDSIPTMLETLRTMSREGKNMMVELRTWLERNEPCYSPAQ